MGLFINDVTRRGWVGRLNCVTLPENDRGGGSPELCDRTRFTSQC